MPLVNRLSKKYSFNREINEERIKREKIILPVTEQGEIDFAFMSSFMQKIESNILKTTIEVFTKRQNVNKCECGRGVNWKPFLIEDIADIVSGRDIYERERTKGNIPYITATASNNGIGYFVDNINDTLEANCLSVNRNGSVGSCYFHPYKALYGNDTRKLRPHHKSKYASLFISMAIAKQKSIYSYGLKLGTGRLRKQHIMLPCTPTGAPDWSFMETVMQNIESRQIIYYLESIQKRVQWT